jgi:hypothetical protein
MSNLSDAFKEGEKSSKLTSGRQGLLRGIVTGLIIAISFFNSLGIIFKILLFISLMIIFGAIASSKKFKDKI